MEINFSSHGWGWLILLPLIAAITILPVKIGAELFQAPNRKLKHCALAVVLGIMSVFLVTAYVNGILSIFLSLIIVSLIYWKILKISLTWSFIFTFIVLTLQIAAIQGINRIGS